MATDPLELFARIGSLVDRRWRDRSYDDAAFPEIAVEILRQEAPHRSLTPRDLLSWLLRTDVLPKQLDPDSSFGQPPITLHSGPRFCIDALFWVEGTTDIHQHGFSGAFHVLAGSSVHTQYEFTLGERVSSAVLLGRVAFRGFELLGPGDTRPIVSGNRLIHGLFHLERPSVTIVVRTYHDAEAGPQYTYRPPSLAEDPTAADPLLKRRLEALGVLHSLDPAAYQEAVGALFDEADFYTVYRAAKHHLAHAKDMDGTRELLERARPRQGARIDVLPAVLAETVRLRTVSEKRALLTGPEHRFFLALLLNLPTRGAVLDAVAQRHPGRDPIELVTGWTVNLADALFGWERDPEADHSPAILAEMLRGHRGGELLARLKEEFDADDVDQMAGDIAEIERSLLGAAMLRPLLPVGRQATGRWPTGVATRATPTR